MLLVIHNLPNNIRYFDIKSLIEEKCGEVQVILDNLTNEGSYKRVTVGLADEGDAALLVRKINGLYLNGCQLFVEDVRHKKASEQPFRPAQITNFEPRAEKKIAYENPEAMQPGGPQMAPMTSMQQMLSVPMASVPMAYSNLPFYMSPVQNSYTSYENQMLIPNKQMPQLQYEQGGSYGYQQPDMQNSWTQPMLTSDPENQNITLGNDSQAPTNRDFQWKERSGDDRNRPVQSQSQRSSHRSPGPKQERFNNKHSKFQTTGRSESGDRSRRPNRSSPQRREFTNNRGKRRNDYSNQKRQSRFERSPPRDRPIDSRDRRGRDERSQFDHYEQDRDSGRTEKRRTDDKRERGRNFDQCDQTRDPDRYEKSRDHDQYTQPREYGQREAEDTQGYNPHDQSSGYSTHDNNQGYEHAEEQPKPYNSRFALRNATPKTPFANIPQGPNPTYGNNPNNPTQKRPFPNVPQGPNPTYGNNPSQKRPFPNVPQGPNPTYSNDPNNSTQKRPFSNVYQGPKSTYSNNPNTSTFSKSNENIFNKNKGNNFGGFVRNSSPKRARMENDNINVGPKVSKPKPTPTQKSESLPMHKLLMRHTGWRHQLAASLAKEMIQNFHPTPIPVSSPLYKKLKEGVVSRIDVILGDNIAQSIAEMNVRYRARFQRSDDVTFFNAVIEKIENEKTKSADKQTDDDKQVNPNASEITPNVTEGTKVNLSSSSETPAPAATTQSFQMPTTSFVPKSNVPMGKKKPITTPPFRAPATDTQYHIKAPLYGVIPPNKMKKGAQFPMSKKKMSYTHVGFERAEEHHTETISSDEENDGSGDKWRSFEVQNSNMKTLIEPLDIPQPSTHIVNLPEFDPGKTDADARSWCATSDLYFADNPMEGSQLIETISKALKGTASTWLSEVSNADMTWTDFKKLFAARFVTAKTTTDTLVNLSTSKPKENEPSAAYGNLVVSLLFHHWSNLAAQQIVVAATQGQILQQELQAFANLKRKATAGPEPQTFENKRVKISQSPVVKCFHCKKIGHMRTDCYDWLKDIKGKPVKSQTVSQAPRSTLQQEANTSSIVCYKCRGQGHISSHCPNKRARRVHLPQGTFTLKGKTEFSQQKMIQKQEYQLENLFEVYDMESPYKEEVDAEIEELVKIFTCRPQKPMDADEEKIYNRIVKEITPTFKRVVKLNLVKRILDIKTGLLVRVFPSPKFPKRASLDAFMKLHGVTSFKKSSTMFVALCDSFRSYDKLIAMGSAAIDDTQITFKTMNILGPKKSVREKMKDAKAKADNEMVFDDDVDIGGFDNDDEIENFNDMEDYNEGQGDVVLIENRQNVVLVEDDEARNQSVDNPEVKTVDEAEVTEDNNKRYDDNVNEQTDKSGPTKVVIDDKVGEGENAENIVQSEINEENVQNLEAAEGIEDDDLEDF